MTRILFLLLAALIIQWPALTPDATAVEVSISWQLLAMVILLAAAVGFLWFKLRGAERNRASAHETIAKPDPGKQGLHDHEQHLRAVYSRSGLNKFW